MKNKDYFRDLEPWVLWILYTIKNDLKPVAQKFLEGHFLNTDSDFEWLFLCKDALLKGDPELSSWVRKAWLLSKEKIASLSREKAFKYYGPSACFIFYSLNNTPESATDRLRELALVELKEQKFFHVQEKLVLLERQYRKDIAQLKQEVEDLQRQLYGCREPR